MTELSRRFGVRTAVSAGFLGMLLYVGAVRSDDLLDRQALSELLAAFTQQQSSVTGDVTATGRTAETLWAMSDEACLDWLSSNGIETEPAPSDVEFVRTPLLLQGPVEGVIFATRWPRPGDVLRSVMDCRLILALVDVARFVRPFGIVRVEFYSALRPVTPPSTLCRRDARRCRAQQTAFDRARAGTFASRHNQALAIDIRWFVHEDGTVWDVLEHYEKRPKQPPCEDTPFTEAGRFLKELACHLHQHRVFNVILTPNADRDHENHFHFDISPGAEWYILR